jgi:hypothetical protein
MFKFICTVFLLLLMSNASAEVINISTKAKNPSSLEYNLDDFNKYKATEKSNFKGRNLNTSTTVSNQKSTSSNLSRTVNARSSKYNAQMDNLESTAGEFIQKVEEDRQKQSEKHIDKYNQYRSNLKTVYTTLNGVDTEKLGNEQDPYVQNAFKCSNIANCDTSDSDRHAIKACASTERLHWTGQEWLCVDAVKNMPGANCTNKQWSKNVNNGTACIDYIYKWVESGLEGCQPNNKDKVIYKCYQKKTVSDSGSLVADSNCYGKKPEEYKACLYYGVWKVGSWSSCSKSCGGGTKTRSVSCTGVVCKDAKPSSSQSCNTSSCRSGSDRDRDRNDRTSSGGRDDTDRAGSSEGRSSKEARGQGGRNVRD